MKYKLIIAVLYMIMSACNNTDSNEFAFSNYSWECPKEGGLPEGSFIGLKGENTEV